MSPDDLTATEAEEGSGSYELFESSSDSSGHRTIAPLHRSRRDLNHEVWSLAWPSVATMLLQTVNTLMDTLFVGHLPNAAASLSATGVGGGVFFILVSLAMGVSVGTSALVARFVGARDEKSAIIATSQSLMLAVFGGIVFGILAFFSRQWVVDLLLNAKSSPVAARLCSEFLGVVLPATLAIFVMNVLQAAFRGLGDTRTPLRITAITVAIHITLNTLLINGRLGFPAMGVRGAGTALSISVHVSCLLSAYFLWKKTGLSESFRRENLRLDMVWVRRILKIGIPASIQALLRTLSMIAFTGLLARTLEGDTAVAALQIGIRTEAFAFMPGFGYSVAAAALVGQSLGAKDPEYAERCGWAALGQSLIVMVVMGIAFFTCAPWIARFFTSDAAVQALGVDYLRINAISEPFIAMGMVLTGALQGAGETVKPTYITIFSMWIVRIPVAWVLMFTLHLHAHGAWITMCLTTLLSGVLTMAVYKRGAWKKIKV